MAQEELTTFGGELCKVESVFNSFNCYVPEAANSERLGYRVWFKRLCQRLGWKPIDEDCSTVICKSIARVWAAIDSRESTNEQCGYFLHEWTCPI